MPEIKPVDVYQGKAVFSLGVFVIQNVPRIVIARHQPMSMQKDGKGHEIFAELALFGFIEFFYAGKGRIGEKTTKEISGVEDSSPVHMHVTDGSSRFNSAASQTQRIPVSPFGFGRAKERINEAIEQSWTRILLDDHCHALIVRGHDRIASIAKYAIDWEILLRQSTDEILETSIIRMKRFLREKKPCVFRFLSRKNRGSKAGKKGEMACILFHISGKRKITEQNSDFFHHGLRPKSLNCPDTA